MRLEKWLRVGEEAGGSSSSFLSPFCRLVRQPENLQIVCGGRSQSALGGVALALGPIDVSLKDKL